MQLPSAEDVNETRLNRFDDQITSALTQTSRIDRFRDIIKHYVNEHDVPEVDVAAALAVVAQGDTPLLLDPAEEKRQRTERPERSDRFDRPDRGGSGGHGGGPSRGRPQRGRSDVPMAPYRIAVGKRHKVEPRQIVGAIANEGGLGRGDFGNIDIRSDHSIVELPRDLSSESLSKLSRTRISGKLIALEPDDGSTPRVLGRLPPRDKKPRHKKPRD